MAVLVTGASGLIGRQVVATLPDPVIGTTRTGTPQETADDIDHTVAMDLRDEDSVRDLPWPDVDSVVHLAAYTDPRASKNDPHRCFETNACGTSALLSAASDAGVTSFVNVSSYWVYEGSATGELDEDTPLAVTTPYGASKAAAEFQCDAFRANESMSVTTLRPFNVYGPGAPRHQVVPSFVTSALETGVIEPHPGNPVRDFLHVRDLAEAIGSCLEAGTNDVFNVGSGSGTSIRTLAETVAEVVEEVTGDTVGTSFSGDQTPTDPKIADIRRITDSLDWRPQTSLHNGIESVIHHYTTNVVN